MLHEPYYPYNTCISSYISDSYLTNTNMMVIGSVILHFTSLSDAGISSYWNFSGIEVTPSKVLEWITLSPVLRRNQSIGFRIES